MLTLPSTSSSSTTESEATITTATVVARPARAYTNKNAARYLAWSDERKQDFCLREQLIPRRVTLWTRTSMGRRTHVLDPCRAASGGIPRKSTSTITAMPCCVRTLCFLQRGDVPQPKHWYDELSSHLCGIPFCLTHMVWELPRRNVSRDDGCHKYNHFPTCPHKPLPA